MEDYREYEETTAEQIEEALMGILRYRESAEDTALANLEDTASFQEGGVMTYNRGLVLRMADGTEFQISIVQSR
ncbi:MAG: hypothetical protein LUD77_10365 [Clostridiales bacterium]|nr:hypothetical protein [Clostridiales bacterium]